MFPSNNQLIIVLIVNLGARSDQLLLRDLFLERLSSDKDKAFFNGSLFVQITNSLSLNWFLSLFHNAVPWQVRVLILILILIPDHILCKMMRMRMIRSRIIRANVSLDNHQSFHGQGSCLY